jgi:hypothetical protein
VLLGAIYAAFSNPGFDYYAGCGGSRHFVALPLPQQQTLTESADRQMRIGAGRLYTRK